MRLTVELLESLRCPDGRRDKMIFDDKQHGLGVRVTSSGRKTYLAQYTRAGVRRRIPLGSCSAISLDDARDAVRKIMVDVANGRDPALERKTARASQGKTAEAPFGPAASAVDSYWFD
jgi:hypothetical protein